MALSRHLTFICGAASPTVSPLAAARSFSPKPPPAACSPPLFPCHATRFVSRAWQNSGLSLKKNDVLQVFLCYSLHLAEKPLPLHRVFHSIRFKVNKVGIQRYPFFYAHTCGAACGRRVPPLMQCAMQRLTFVNLENAREIHHAPPRSEITQTWRGGF